jgi:hypothetical protein
MKAAAFTQGNVYWRVPYIDTLTKENKLNTKILHS